MHHGGYNLANRLKKYIYWTSNLSLIDTCQNKISSDQYQVTISRAQVYSLSRSCVFNLTTDQVLIFPLDRELKQVNFAVVSTPGPGCSKAG